MTTMNLIQKSIEVHVPVRVAYAQWMHIEDFPTFMDNVDAIERIDYQVSRWLVNVGGSKREYLLRITEEDPDRLIVWTNTTVPSSGGSVTFEPLGADSTRVTLVIAYKSSDLEEKV